MTGRATLGPLPAALTALALLLLVAGPAGAQGQPNPAEAARERELRYYQLFQDGLQALTGRDLKRSEQLFKACIELFPDRAVNYYNLACTYSLGEQPEQAVEQLRLSFQKGFKDLAHMERDMDLDPIRTTPLFRAALAEFERDVLQGVPDPLSRLPEGTGPFPLLVWIPAPQAQPERDLDQLARTLPGWAVLVPRPGQGGWGESAEFLVIRAVREFLQGHAQQVDRRTTYAVGQGQVGFLAVGAVANHPELFAGALAAGPNLAAQLDDDLTLSNSRAYLVVKREDADEIKGGVAAREAFVRGGSPVVLERYPLDQPFTRDRALLLRGLTWLRGEQVALPGAGEERPF